MPSSIGGVGKEEVMAEEIPLTRITVNGVDLQVKDPSTIRFVRRSWLDRYAEFVMAVGLLVLVASVAATIVGAAATIPWATALGVPGLPAGLVLLALGWWAQ